MPAWAIKGVYSLKHDELVQKGIGFLIDEEVLPEKEAKCLVTSLNKAMAESTFDSTFRYALTYEDPFDILKAPKSDSRLPTAKKKRIYQESYDSCMKGEEGKSDSEQKEDAKSQTQGDLIQKAIDLCVATDKSGPVYCRCQMEALKKRGLFEYFLSYYT